MNKNFKVIWCISTRAWTVVSELAKSKCKSGSSTSSTQYSQQGERSDKFLTLNKLSTALLVASTLLYGSVTHAVELRPTGCDHLPSDGEELSSIVTGCNADGKLKQEATIFGASGITNADGGTAIGAKTTISAKNGTALGRGASVTSGATDSVAIGANSIATEKDTVSFGGPMNDNTGAEKEAPPTARAFRSLDALETTNPIVKTRRLVNVTAGINDTDAVNVSQLKYFSDALGGGMGNTEGKFIAPTYTVNGETVHSVGEALTKIDGRVTTIQSAMTTLTNREQPKYFQANATGEAPNASGTQAIAIGANSNASGASSIASGDGAKASGTGSNAVGINAEASGTGSIAVGSGAKASGYASNAVGSGAKASGTGSNAVGINAEASGTGSIAVGIDTKASGTGSIAVGPEAQAQEYSTAIGTEASAQGLNSTAIGHQSSTSGNNSVALGQGASASAENSAAIGAGSIADRANSVSMGSAGHERQITNVAQGTHETDAVNVGQLNSSLNTLNNNSEARYSQLRSDLKKQDSTLSAGIAGAMAMANLPQPTSSGASMVAAGMGNYRGQSAVTVGLSHVSNDGKWVTKMQASTSTKGDAGLGVGVGYQW